jgi:hypothetical protein
MASQGYAICADDDRTFVVTWADEYSRPSIGMINDILEIVTVFDIDLCSIIGGSLGWGKAFATYAAQSSSRAAEEGLRMSFMSEILEIRVVALECLSL